MKGAEINKIHPLKPFLLAFCKEHPWHGFCLSHSHTCFQTKSPISTRVVDLPPFRWEHPLLTVVLYGTLLSHFAARTLLQHTTQTNGPQVNDNLKIKASSRLENHTQWKPTSSIRADLSRCNVIQSSMRTDTHRHTDTLSPSGTGCKLFSDHPSATTFPPLFFSYQDSQNVHQDSWTVNLADPCPPPPPFTPAACTSNNNNGDGCMPPWAPITTDNLSILTPPLCPLLLGGFIRILPLPRLIL